MKAKRLFILLALAAVAMLSACNKYEVYEGVLLYQRDFNVKSTDWSVLEATDASGNPNGGYILSVKLNVPEITQKVVEYGQVTVSRKLYDEKGNVYWTPLPCSRAEAIDYNTEKEYLYSTYLDYEWGYGNVDVFFTATDLYVDENKDNRPAMELRVTVMI